MKNLLWLDECVGRIKTVKATVSLSNATKRAVCCDETIRIVSAWRGPGTLESTKLDIYYYWCINAPLLTCSFDRRKPPLPSHEPMHISLCCSAVWNESVDWDNFCCKNSKGSRDQSHIGSRNPPNRADTGWANDGSSDRRPLNIG